MDGEFPAQALRLRLFELGIQPAQQTRARLWQMIAASRDIADPLPAAIPTDDLALTVIATLEKK